MLAVTRTRSRRPELLTQQPVGVQAFYSVRRNVPGEGGGVSKASNQMTPFSDACHTWGRSYPFQCLCSLERECPFSNLRATVINGFQLRYLKAKLSRKKMTRH